MEPEEFLKRAQNPNNISGIYNYCDRWCERCTFTNRCLNFDKRSIRNKNIENLDTENKEYWNELESTFADTMKLILHIAEKEGIDLTKMDNADSQKRDDSEKKASKHLISTQAKSYNTMAHEFFEREKSFIENFENDLNTQLKLGINEGNILIKADEVKDIFEIINWYSLQITVKMKRALSGKFNGEEFADENDFPRDSDGSAKVALIGIDRSISAWGKLQQLFPEKTDDLISILLLLDKLRNEIEKEFPTARSFIRAGFDE